MRNAPLAVASLITSASGTGGTPAELAALCDVVKELGVESGYFVACLTASKMRSRCSSFCFMPCLPCKQLLAIVLLKLSAVESLGA